MNDRESGDAEFSSSLWIVTLGVYVLLLFITGYLAFYIEMPRAAGGAGQYNPAHVPKEFLEWTQQQKEQTQTYVFDTLKEDSQAFQKKRELASQSFNVVLGAILGFLSASATFLFGKRIPPKKKSQESDNRIPIK